MPDPITLAPPTAGEPLFLASIGAHTLPLTPASSDALTAGDVRLEPVVRLHAVRPHGADAEVGADLLAVRGVEQLAVDLVLPVRGAEVDVVALPDGEVAVTRGVVRDGRDARRVVARVAVRPDGAGSVVTYDAELTLRGPLALADPLLGIAFERLGDRAADGLVEFLAGERIDADEAVRSEASA